MYKHTQFGLLTAIFLGVALIVTLVVVSMTKEWFGLIIAGVLLLAELLFATLTVAVDRDALRFHFGIGLIRKTIPLRDIETVRVVRNSWLYGWGIRYTPHGWLYNVSGLGAVELQLRSGKKMRIGSDEPKRLARAIEGMKD